MQAYYEILLLLREHSSLKVGSQIVNPSQSATLSAPLQTYKDHHQNNLPTTKKDENVEGEEEKLITSQLGN